jgi:hypothetical protein
MRHSVVRKWHKRVQTASVSTFLPVLYKGSICLIQQRILTLNWVTFRFSIFNNALRKTTVCVRTAGRPAQPRTQHDCHHDTKVKPEAATAVIELLMMCGKTPETRWAVNKRQDNKMKNCCIRLVIYLNCTRSRVWFPMVAMEFFIDLILPAALWPLGWLSL